MKKTLFILCALLLTAVGASAQGYVNQITNTQATWMGATGAITEGPERYQTTNYTAGKVLYQSIAGLSAGEYTVTFYAVASSTSGRGFYNIYGENIAQVFANETTQDVEVIDQTSIADLKAYSYTLTCTVGVDGILEYGLQNIAAGGNWYVCQGVSYTCTQTSSPTVNVGDLHVCEAEIGHWTTTGNNGTFVLNDWSVEADASGMKTPFCQNWVWEGEDASVLLTTAKISHAPFSGLPQGYYYVSLDIRIFSEAGKSIGTGTTFNANSASEDLDDKTSEGHEGSYGNATEVYGTYQLIANVGEDGKLDISIQLAENPTYNWIAWKNLKVEYLGETLEYEIHEPECPAKVVRSGDKVSIVYECITPDNTAGTPTLDTTQSISVGNSTVAATGATLSWEGYSATVTFTVPTITEGGDITISVPEGLIYWDTSVMGGSSNVLSPEATFTVHTPATITDGDYLIMNAEGNYLGGGLAWGTQAVTIGKPQFIGFGKQDDGTYHLDSYQYNGNTAHYLSADLWFDTDTPAGWTLVAIEGGYALYYAETDRYVTDNGFQEAATLSAEPTVWTLVTMDDVVASMTGASEESPVDVTALIKAPELKRNSNSDDYKTWTCTGYSDTNAPNNYHFGDPNGAVANCGESYHSTNGFNFSQDITLPLAGTYTLSAKGFYSGTPTGGVDLPVLYADDQTSTFPELTTNAASMADAYIEFLEGMNEIEAITITTTSPGETVTIGFKGADTSLWNIMGELELLCYGVDTKTVEWEMTDAGWGTLILPFDADIPTTDDSSNAITWTAYSCAGLESDDETLTLTNETTLVANTPYILSGTPGTYTFKGTPEEATGDLTQGLLTGTFVDMDYNDLIALSGTVYLLQNHTGANEGGVAFYPVVETSSAAATLTPYHCYLTTSSGSGVRAHIDFPSSDGEATAIVAVEGAEAEANGAIYDLSGRKVSKAVKGVYIQNGKKVLVK